MGLYLKAIFLHFRYIYAYSYMSICYYEGTFMFLSMLPELFRALLGYYFFLDDGLIIILKIVNDSYA